MWKISSASCSALRPEVRALQAKHDALGPLYALKRKFVQKKGHQRNDGGEGGRDSGRKLATELEALFGEPLTEQSYVEHVSRWLDAEAEHGAQLGIAQQYAAWAALAPAGRHKHLHGVLFRVPHNSTWSIWCLSRRCT